MDEFKRLLSSAWPGLSPDLESVILRYYALILEENEIQNLTRLTSPQDFLDGHVLDVKELAESKLLEFPCMDLGSGGGVPGLLYAALFGGKWVLAESEGRKAAFLERAAGALGVSTQVEIFAGRGEEYLRRGGSVRSVCARAVGPLDRIYGWFRACSTWNTLVLLKGPKWEAEWASFAEGPHRRELQVSAGHQYRAGIEEKFRVIVKLTRVPRGT